MAEFNNKCEYHIAHEQTLTRHENDINILKDDVNCLRISQTEVNTKFLSFMESMSKLPEILESMKEAINCTGYEIKDMKQDIEEIKASQSKNDDRMNDKVNRIEEDVKTVDEKSKIDLLQFIKGHAWEIIAIVLAGYATIMNIIK